MANSRTALIIGASRGLGLGLVQRLHEDGWHITATVRNPQQPGALACSVAQVQDIGTYLMLTAKVGEHTLKARFSPETRLPSAGDTVWLQVLGEHTCYYQNEELLA